jgi:hypothetical protein
MFGIGTDPEAFNPDAGLLLNGTRNADAMPLSLDAMSVDADEIPKRKNERR